ncbi:WD domain, G-beta repeat [Rhizoctonia solani]|uniref:Peroxin-7 n=1 Tax=Rhizoctonia solani TaxID=456999 RepID=A0A8H7IKM9_9AGAM|nr:WD domain, G-beta repeat [Rhizoctonia solani]
MVHFSWLALSLSVAGIVSASGAIYEDGTRMLKHRRVSRSSLHHRTPGGLARRAGAKTYKIADNYFGDNFFDGWDFFSESDPTNGNVNYLTKSDAFSKKLAYVQDNGTVIMKVDDTTWVSSGGNRNSVRIASSKSYTQGLFVLDVETMPHGCGVWPAWWTVGPSWPNGGEIDILEGVHNQESNQMTLHTSSGCTLDTGLLKLKTSTILSKNCDAAVNSNAGCAFLDSDKASYGSGSMRQVVAPMQCFGTTRNLKSKTNATADPSTWEPQRRTGPHRAALPPIFSTRTVLFSIRLFAVIGPVPPTHQPDALTSAGARRHALPVTRRETISGPDIRAQTNVDPIGPDSDSFNFPSVSYHVRIYQPNCIVAQKPFAHHSVAFSLFIPMSQGHPPAPTGAGGFDASTLRIDRAYRTQDGLYDLAWSELHENQIVTASGDGSLRLWDITMTDLPVRVWHEHVKEVYSVDWSNLRKDRFVSSSWDGLDTYERSVHPNYSAHSSCVYQALFSPHTPDILATASTDGTMRLFDLRVPLHSLQPAANPNAPTLPLSSTPLARPSLTIPAHGTEILSLDWNKYRPWVLASSSVDKSVKIWDARQIQSNPTGEQGLVGGTCEIDLLGHEYAVRKVQWSPHRADLLATASYDMTCRVWSTNVTLGRPPLLAIHDLHTEFVVGCAWSLFEEGVIASCGWDCALNIFAPK